MARLNRRHGIRKPYSAIGQKYYLSAVKENYIEEVTSRP